MSATGLEVFDKTLQTTNIWLDQIGEQIGPDRHHAWHVLRAVLHSLRDRLPLGSAVHLGAQLPMLVRGMYYDSWHPSDKPTKEHTREAFVGHVAEALKGTRPTNPDLATRAVLGVLATHVTAEQMAKIKAALPGPIRGLWSGEEVQVANPSD